MEIQRFKCTRLSLLWWLIDVCIGIIHKNNVPQIHLHVLLHCMQYIMQANFNEEFNVVVQCQK